MSSPLRLLAVAALASACALSAQGPALIQGSSRPAYLPLDGVTLRGLGQGPAVTLDGNIMFALSDALVCLGTDPSVPGCPGSDAETELRLKVGVALDLEADASGTISQRRTLFVFPIAFFYWPFAGLSGQIVADGALTVEGDVEAGMRANFVAQTTSGARMTFADGETATTEEPERGALLVGAPEVTGNGPLSFEVGVESGVTVVFAFAGLPVASPFFRIRTAAELEVDPTDDPWWSIRGYLAPVAGWNYSRTTLDFPKLFDFDLAEAEGPLRTDPRASERWSKIYDFDSIERAVDVAVDPRNQDLLILGDPDVSGHGAYLARTSPSGEPIWEVSGRIDVQTTMEPIGMVVADDGSVLVAGSHADALRTVEFDKRGRVVSGTDWREATGLVFYPDATSPTDDGYVVAGHLVRTSPFRNEPTVLRFDDANRLLWARELELDTALGADNGVPRSVFEASNGDLVVSGYVEYGAMQGSLSMAGRNALVWCLDARGRTRWVRSIGGIGFEEAFDVTECNGMYVFAGRASSQPHSAWVAALGTDGSLLWSTVFSHLAAGGVDAWTPVVNGIACDAEGGALLTGAVLLGPASEGFVAKVDAAGDIVWFKTFRGPLDDELSGLRAMDRGLLAWGRTRSATPFGVGGAEWDMWLCRTSVDGMSHFLPTSSFGTENDAIGQESTPSFFAVDLPANDVARRFNDTTIQPIYDPVQAVVVGLTR
jgi:hypothetical protein